MALEAALLSGGGVYQHQDYMFGMNNTKDSMDWDFDHFLINHDYSDDYNALISDDFSTLLYPPASVHHYEPLLGTSSSDQVNFNSSPAESGDFYAPMVVSRPKRRRSRARKNKEEIENQRRTHIAVERNRRKQMNHYLSLLRSLMPQSYAERGDQASIVGGAINFVKELEQNLQCLSATKHHPSVSLPFGEFFTFPQYTTAAVEGDRDVKSDVSGGEDGGEAAADAAAGDVEVTMVESHALVKIRSKRPPKQLSKLVMGLQGLRLTILHLNLTKFDGVALYSFSLKMEDESKLSSVDEIAEAVNQLLGRIQEESNNNNNNITSTVN